MEAPLLTDVEVKVVVGLVTRCFGGGGGISLADAACAELLEADVAVDGKLCLIAGATALVVLVEADVGLIAAIVLDVEGKLLLPLTS